MYTLKKIQQQINQVHDFWFNQLTDDYAIDIYHDERPTHITIPADGRWEAFEVDDIFSGRDNYFWIRFAVPVPKLISGQRYMINVGVLRNNDNGTSIPEGLVFVNGTPTQAVDGNHRNIFLDNDFSDQTVQIAICFWTGLEGSELYPEPTFTYRTLKGGIFDADGYYCYRYLDVMAQAAQEFDDDEPLKYSYLKFLSKATQEFDWGQMTPVLFSTTVQHIQKNINTFIAEHEGEKKKFEISAIGHTHIDVAWLWRLQHTRGKTARSFSTELSLMKEFPDYYFMHSTPQVYDFIKEDYPELFAQIKVRLAEGRWDADGIAWVEPDMNIPSGEALTRQFLYGKQFFADNFNAEQSVLWLPDVFGYSAALPQIMKNFGIKNFMTTKISWNDTNHMPHDTFNWRGIDGSEVLTYFITTVEQNYDYHSNSSFGTTYNGMLTPHTVLGSYHMYQDKALNDNLLLCFGYGDGGGGPTREMVENIKIMNQLPGLPTVKAARVDDYFEQLHQNIAASGEKVPEWVGELYLEFHRGTYTSQARVKKQNRQFETALRNLEMRCVEAYVFNKMTYPTTELHELWKILMRNQFHDILPGSSIKEVYEDNLVEYTAAFSKIAELNQKLDDQQVVLEQNYYSLRNNLAWDVEAKVQIKQSTSGYFETATGEKLASTLLADNYLVNVPSIAALGTSTIHFVAEKKRQVESVEHFVSQTITTKNYQISWNDAGQLIQIYDKVNARNVLKGPGNVLTIYEDHPLDWDNWNIDEDYLAKAAVVSADTIEVTENSPLQTVVTFTYHYHQSTIQQKMILSETSRRIDFENKIDWQEHHELLRTAFSVDVLAEKAQFDIQYGNVSRPTHQNTSWDEARFETVGHKWADLSQHDYGVALLNDSKYGYDVNGQTLSLSLIKSGTWPDANADQGEHYFTYSLLPHEGDFVIGQVEKEASELNNSVELINGKYVDPTALFTFTDEKNPIAVDAIKLSEQGDAIILRFHDYSGESSQVKVKSNFAHKSVAMTNLAETEKETLAEEDSWVTVASTPYQVISLAFMI